MNFLRLIPYLNWPVNNGIMPVSWYFKADVNILGFTVPQVGFLIVKDPSTLLIPPSYLEWLDVTSSDWGVRNLEGFMDSTILMSLLAQEQCIQLCFHNSALITIRVSFSRIQLHWIWQIWKLNQFELIQTQHLLQIKIPTQLRIYLQITYWDRFGLVILTKASVFQLTLQKSSQGKQIRFRNDTLVLSNQEKQIIYLWES